MSNDRRKQHGKASPTRAPQTPQRASSGSSNPQKPQNTSTNDRACDQHQSHSGLTDCMRSLATALARGEESRSADIQSIDSSVYLDNARFGKERAALFHRLPVPLMPSASLASGQAKTHDHYGLPLLVTRDRSSTVRVMLNVCRHRGTRLVEEDGLITASALVCPYHAWTYRLDGTLKGLPRQDTFPGLDKARYGLRQYAAVESGGLLWTKLDGSAIEDGEALGALADDFDALKLAQSHVFSSRVHQVNANWKLIMDAFLESYHVQRLHKATIAPFFADSITRSNREGLHFRSVVARTDYAHTKDHEAFDQLRQKITFSYSLLPAAVVVVSPDYINVMLIYPKGPGQSFVEDFMLVPEKPVTRLEHEHWAESFAFLDDGVFGAEDFRAAELGQQGLASGGLETLTLGTAEYAVAEFHQTVEQLLGDQARQHSAEGFNGTDGLT